MSDLEQVARFLGGPYKVDRLIYKPIGSKQFVDEDVIVDGCTNRCSDGALLLALLMRAAELECNTYLNWVRGKWSANIKGQTLHYGPTPLAAMIQAVVKYQEGQP